MKVEDLHLGRAEVISLITEKRKDWNTLVLKRRDHMQLHDRMEKGKLRCFQKCDEADAEMQRLRGACTSSMEKKKKIDEAMGLLHQEIDRCGQKSLECFQKWAEHLRKAWEVADQISKLETEMNILNAYHRGQQHPDVSNIFFPVLEEETYYEKWTRTLHTQMSFKEKQKMVTDLCPQEESSDDDDDTESNDPLFGPPYPHLRDEDLVD
ncbi:hypothetical protein BU24DRAFT_458059 [Aaosphaeria arxii CBS 175.79]|uniref:Uncharacterized protein n=1 Tax=Aaosphaeria arxii CBS 175.79 TaxID=1450172 RepID=A0A6A5YC78_9PLEO|nr:uncharacterized protein BU24DRAFT_458059 [Aaosphaeria arxii CBS 175.79]KAF2022181.1 hypothetical protein BU24DRAFT_458059 [Aaosphaeria arxii CBS 175.79]